MIAEKEKERERGRRIKIINHIMIIINVILIINNVGNRRI